MASGKLDEACGAFEQALAHDGELPDAWYNLGYLQRCSRRFTDALFSYRRALACGIDRPEEARVNIAIILSEHLNRVSEGEAELKIALELNP